MWTLSLRPAAVAALLLSSIALPAAQPAVFPASWTWEENGWTGTWTRRGGTGVYDVVWAKGAERGHSIVTLHQTGSASFCAHRQDTQGWSGQEVDYSGALASDGSARGTGRVRGTGQLIEWKARPGGSAVPPPPPVDRLGRTWRTEENGWTGAWTRRGSSNTFDVEWRNGGSRGSSVCTVEIQGSSLRIHRRDLAPWTGQQVDYTATLSGDGAFHGRGVVRGSGLTYTWSGRIQ